MKADKKDSMPALRIAQRMLADGIARETVVKITGLTADEIAALAH